jgi:polysaccharide export outer membrane protein
MKSALASASLGLGKSERSISVMSRVLLLLLLMVIQASAQNSAPYAEPSLATTSTVKSPTSISTEDSEYVIGPEDVLQINVWKEADISGPVPVRPDGKISLPLLSDVQAAGLTPQHLATDITERLKHFITDPRVTVIVTAMNSRRAYIMGQVTRQGAILLVSNLTVLQALSAAGGPAQFANTKKIYILRTEGGKQVKIPFNYASVIKGKTPEQNINLKPGDTIVVP